MKASETNFFNFYKVQNQFIIPIYQRKYSWTIDQCREHWNDIVRASMDDEIKGHFVGSIFYIERGLNQISAVPQLLVIDGQQRMTTLSVVVCFGKSKKESEETYDITNKKLKNYYIVNNDEEDNLYHKLLLTKADKKTLLSLVNEKELPDELELV